MAVSGISFLHKNPWVTRIIILASVMTVAAILLHREPTAFRTLPRAADGSRLRASAWSADGRHLANSNGEQIVIWDTQSWNPIVTVDRSMTGRIFAIAWDPTSSRLASASIDGAVHIWDVKTHGLIDTLQIQKDDFGSLFWTSRKSGHRCRRAI